MVDGLVERAGELGELRAALAGCRQRRGGTVLVRGEAGIGKTTLIDAFRAEVAAAGGRVLGGACEDLLTPRPLGPFRDMFRDAGLAAPAAGDRDRWIDALLAELAGPAQLAGTTQLAGLAGTAPVVVVVEDAHWADDATLDILRYVGRRVDRLPALLVVSYRDALDEQHPLCRVLGGFTAAVRLALRPLSTAAVERLASLAGRDAQGLASLTGGNPFFVAEALAAPGGAVPATVRDAVAARVRALPAAAQRALELLSVIPGEADAGLLETALAAPASVLEPAERAGLVAVRGGRVGFRHELARRAVEGGLPATRRILLNRQVLSALEPDPAGPGQPADPVEPSRLVHHAVGAADRAAVARLAPLAALEAASSDAHHESLAFSTLALEHAELLPAAVAARMHGLAGYALYALNRFGEAAAQASAAVSRWEALPQPVELGRALLLSARMQTMLGRPDAARAQASRALRVLEPAGTTPELAHAYGLMGNLDAIEADCAGAVDWCRRAAAAARELGRRDLEAHAVLYLGVARVGLAAADPGPRDPGPPDPGPPDPGPPDPGPRDPGPRGAEPPGLAELRRALWLAGAADHGEYRCRAASTLATVLVWLGRHRDALPYLEQAEGTARDHGYDYHLFHTLAQRGHVDLFLGRWEEAEQGLRGLLAGTHDPAAVVVLPMALLGRLLLRRGEEEGRTLSSRAYELACASRQAHRIAVAGGALVEDAWLRDDPSTVDSLAAVLLPLADRANLPYLRGEVLRYRARCGLPADPFRGCPEGFALGLAGDWKGAAAAWEEAGNPYEQALELTGAALECEVFDGLRRLDELGADGAAALVRRRLRQQGVRGVPRGPQRATRSNPAGLTSRQYSVLRLLGEGLSSSQIAARMYVSPRTVDNHVNGILARLGVSSRRVAVAVAADHGWLDPSGSPARSE
jgi:DNA-binding CsgD family transcriptional regulator/tetratricopeptide (TPR) repeat protein